MTMPTGWPGFSLAYNQRINPELSDNLRPQGPHGWLCIHKPTGITSARVVAVVKRCFKGVKTGHAGTLDPLASGVLPIALGEATKTISYVMTAEKSYRFSVKWGAETQTDDTEGSITRTADYIPPASAITDILPQFIGLIDQSPPDYSTVKIQCKRAYALARSRDKAGQDILNSETPNRETPNRETPNSETSAIETSAGAGPLLAARKIRIDSLELLSAEAEEAHFEVHCGKGAYIRSLARDMGRALGSAAHVTALERRSVGKFHLDNAISLDFLQEIGQGARAFEPVISVMTVLDDIPAVALTDDEAKRLRFGQKLSLDLERQALLRRAFADSGDREHTDRAIAVFEGRPVALVQLENSILSPIRVLNL